MKALRYLKFSAATLFAGAAFFVAQLAAAPLDREMYLNPDQVKWMDGPSGLPKGAKMAVLAGDPMKPGMFVVRFMTPANYIIPPHWHSRTENLTVLSGNVCLGDGDKADLSHAHLLPVGGFHHLPANTHHFAFTKGPATIQIEGEGPFDIRYVNPMDDPRNVAMR